MTAEQIAELKRWIAIANQPYQPRYRAAKQDARAMVTRFAPDLIAALEAAEALIDDLEARIDDLEAEVEELENNSIEYEKDCTKALCSLAREFDYEWDGDGATADDLREFIATTVEEAEAERDERKTMAARAQEAMRYLLNGLPATDAIWAAYGNADSARAWLAARDARLKNEGAAEWLESHRDDDWLAVDQRERFDREAAALRRKAGE